MLLNACTELRSKRSQEPNPDEGFSLENDIRVHAGNVLQHLSYGTVLMLALMTWYFDTSSSEAPQDLITFLRWPPSEVRRILQDRYRSNMCGTELRLLFVLD